MRFAPLLGTAALALMVTAGCSSTTYGGGNGCTSTATKVCAVDNAFSPLTLTVAAGTTVSWENGGGTTHSVTSDTAESFNTDLPPGQTTSHKFNPAGTYTFHCRFHGAPGAGMHGTITVN